ncbi:hypothetical protein ACOMHN_032600 [Nucella lapillus]
MDTPKIEVTEISPASESDFYPEVHEPDSDQWPELFHAGGDFLEQSLGQLQDNAVDSRADLCSPQRRSFSRRCERGPGKSPSPSRHSPRRHSPVPYSPKRQHRAASPAVSLDEYYDVMLSPTRHSPVPHLVDGSRAQSLTSDEFTCISYSDPFSSPVFHHPQSVLGASTERGCQMDSSQPVEMGSNDISSMDVVADVSQNTSWLDAACLSPEDRCLEDALVLLEEGGFQDTPGTDGQDSDLFLYEVDEQQSLDKKWRSLTHTDSGHFLAASCPDPAPFYDPDLTGQSASEKMCLTTVETNSSNYKTEISEQTGKVPLMADKVCVVDAVDAGADSSSEDEMEDEMVTVQNGAVGIDGVSQPCVMTDFSAAIDLGQASAFQSSDSTTSPTLPNMASADVTSSLWGTEAASMRVFTETGERTSPQDGVAGANPVPFTYLSKDSGFQYFPPQQCTVEELSLDDPLWYSLEEKKTIPALDSQGAKAKQTFAMESKSALEAEEEQSKESTDLSILKHFSNEYNSSQDVFPDDIMNFSLCTQHSPDRPPSVSASIVLEDSPETTYHHVTKTPEDFTLPRLVGSPPLQFPHCHNVLLIHNALSNPYNPDLPTPPIVLTSHDTLGGTSPSPFAFEESIPFYSPPTMYNYGPAWSTGDCYSRSDISMTSSCPNLHQMDNHQFRNPHPAWSPPQRFWDNGMGAQTMSAQTDQEGRYGIRYSVQNPGPHPMTSSPGYQADPVSCFRMPTASPCSSFSRAAVKDRLRKMVERRISGSLDSLKTS